MKQIVCLFQGGQQLDIVQCLRCMEVFIVATKDTAMVSERRDAAVALGERHRAECPDASP